MTRSSKPICFHCLLRSLTGPLLLMAAGGLLLLGQLNPQYPFSEFWPALLLVFGLLRVLEAILQPADPALCRDYQLGRGRRHSIFTGLLLLVLGALLLVHNLLPGVVHLGRVARYWPALLILWGLARLWDWWRARRTGQAPPLVMGHELALAVFAVLLLAAWGSYENLRERHPDWDLEVHIFDRSFEFPVTLEQKGLSGGSVLHLQVPRGDITVQAEPAPSVQIVATQVVYATTREAAQRLAEQTQLRLEAVPDGWRLAPLDRLPHDLNLDVHAFQQLALDAKTGHGNLRVKDLTGALTLSAAQGKVDIENAGDSVRLELVRGDARISGVQGNLSVTGRGEQLEIADVRGTTLVAGEFYGPIRLRQLARTVTFTSSRTSLHLAALPGQLVLDSGQLELSGGSGDFSLDTRNKDIQLERVSGSLHISNRYGDVTVRFEQSPRYPADIETTSGNIEVILPASAHCVLEAHANKGEVVNEFGHPSPVRIGENMSLSGVLGSGGPKVTLTTTYGTIRIRRLPATTSVPPQGPSTD